MVINFRTYIISRGTRKLTQTFMLIKKNWVSKDVSFFYSIKLYAPPFSLQTHIDIEFWHQKKIQTSWNLNVVARIITLMFDIACLFDEFSLFLWLRSHVFWLAWFFLFNIRLIGNYILWFILVFLWDYFFFMTHVTSLIY